MTGKNKKLDRQKRGLKLFFFPKPQGQKHKHKKNKYYVSHHDDWSPTGSIMSGDSPTHHNRTAEAFDYSSSNQPESRPQLIDSKPLPATDGRSSPVPTTSKDVAVQSTRADEKAGDKVKGEVQASVLVEPGGGKDDDDNKNHFGSPTLNHSESGGEKEHDEERRGKNDDGGFGGRDKKDRKDDKFRKNGNIDKLDGVWIPKEKKPQEDDQDDNCIVKCLYVTMTCCECSIM